MGHKVNPECLRLSISRDWRSRWFAANKKQFVQQLHQDRKIREFLKKELASAAVSRVVIERSAEKIRVWIHTARPGILIGRRGENIQRLEQAIQKIVGTQQQLKMEYVEIKNPSIEAQLIADSLTFQLEKRIAFRRAMKRAIQQAMESKECKGIKIVCDGRLAGAEMTRREVYRAGTVPLGTLRSRIDFATSTAHTTAGCIGVKVWACRGELVSMERSKGNPRLSATAENLPERETAPAPSETKV
ncbi:MAG: 30S ribosomal protein S3 [Candidatus Omnitrophica bacterium]|nr:30S ribosomal protein S3 [Candidatus Omnitrophota bacterium]MBI2174063.1 30S ribosomal protein S3 [Candidatus Omnitrophota bacterium]MBI3010668.1 30S ribosomal protein S3 [Candidatus Omnitrophota bacterium]